MSLIKSIDKKYQMPSKQEFHLYIPEMQLPDEGITAISGPSGSGKTTLFRILIGLEDCPGMQWHLWGEDMSKVPVEKRRFGVVFQEGNLFDHMTAKENLKFAAEARKIKNEKEKIDSLTEQLMLDACINTKASLISGGEKQRVSLARALIGEPKYLFLDEPFSALDEELKSSTRQLVKSTIEKYDIPTLLITHDKKDVKALANKVIYIKDGRLI